MKIIFYISTILYLVVSDYTVVIAQCGVTPRLANEAGGIMHMNINAGPTTFDPNWVAYGWQWEVNNSVISTDSILDPFGILLPAGFSNICLRISATDTLTGDSCTKELCNVFQSTGYEIFPELNVSANGLTATASGYWFGGHPNGSPSVTIEWGDGATSNQASDVHTYAVPGEYLVTLTIIDNLSFFSSVTHRKVQVNTGLPNMTINNMQGSNSVCYPFSTYGSTTTPPHPNAIAYLYGYCSTAGSGQNFVSGAMLNFPASPQATVVPGQAMIAIDITDVNPGNAYPIYRWAPVFFDNCGAVPDTIKGFVFSDLDADGIKDPGEPGLPNHQIRLGSSNWVSGLNYRVYTDSAGFYSILAPNALLTIDMNTLPAGSIITFPGNSWYTNIDAVVNNTFPLYNFGIANLNTTISGTVFLDFNQDSVRNIPPDADFKNVTVKAENTVNGLTYYEHTNANGIYTFKLSSGNYIITPSAFNLDSADFFPDTIIINSTGGTFNNQHFSCYSPVNGNLGVRIFGANEARPGFDYYNRIEIKNTGFDTLSGTIVFLFDSLLTANSVTPTYGVIDNINHTVTWQISNLPATYYGQFDVNYTIPVSTPLGTVLNFAVQGSVGATYTDSDLSNNYDTYSQTVIGSFDPNDKAVDPAGIGAQNSVLHGDRLHYRIRFQNTGTASAIHVFVQDEIDPDLDMSTLLMERASHSYDMVTNDRTITWKFVNVNLPDSNTNEPASHGYIEYSIKAIQGLADGTEIENTAAIYFDFNAPVVTNTTLNTLQTTLVSVDEIETEENLMLYPVPARNELTISSGIKLIGEVSVELLDLQGRVIKSIYEGTSIGTLEVISNVSELSSGVYVIRVINSKQVMRRMFVKQ